MYNFNNFAMNLNYDTMNKTTITTVILSPIIDFYYPMRYMLLLAIVLVICDLRWGVKKSRKRGEEIRKSRALRRTINKFIDYLCWVTLASLFGSSFGTFLGIPALAIIILMVIYGIELNSCFNNYFEAKGIKTKVNIFKLFKKNNIIDEDTTR